MNYLVINFLKDGDQIYRHMMFLTTAVAYELTPD